MIDVVLGVECGCVEGGSEEGHVSEHGVAAVLDVESIGLYLTSDVTTLWSSTIQDC